MTLEEYQQLNQTELSTQSYLQKQFKILIDNIEIKKLQDVLNDCIKKGIYFERNESVGYMIRPIYGDGYLTRQDWQLAKSILNDDDKCRTCLMDLLSKLSAQIITSEEVNNDTNDADHVDAVEEEILKTAPNAEYFNHCHNYVFDVQSQSYLLKTGLYLYIDYLQIGYDTSTKEIILPIDEIHYHAIKLKFDCAVDEREAQKVLRHYNLKPFETAKWHLFKDETGKLIDGGKNYEEPYRTDSIYSKLSKTPLPSPKHSSLQAKTSDPTLLRPTPKI